MNWSYDRDNQWGDDFKQCKNKKMQSPINIDTSMINSKDPFRSINKCNIGCQLTVYYNSSKCHVINEYDTPTVYFDSGSYIQYNGHQGDEKYPINSNNIFELHKMTMHTPSMHTINSMRYDMEINLYHYSLGDMLENIQNELNYWSLHFDGKTICDHLCTH